MNKEYIYRGENRMLFFTPKGEEYIREVFPNNSNKWICEQLDISFAVLYRLIKQLDLEKSKEYIHNKCAKGGYNLASKINSLPDDERERYTSIKRKIGKESKNLFKKGRNPKEIGEEAYKAQIAKIVERRMETRRKDKARITFGLEQKSRIYFKPPIPDNIYKKLKLLRQRMKKTYNYVCDRFKLSAKITNETKRNLYLETRLISLGGSVIDTRTNIN